MTRSLMLTAKDESKSDEDNHADGAWPQEACIFYLDQLFHLHIM